MPSMSVREKPPTHLSQIAIRLRATRVALGFGGRRQRHFAEAASIEPNTYNQWEKGHGRPDLDGALKLCEHYPLTLDWIYRGDNSCLPHHLVTKLAQVGPGSPAD